MELFGVFEMYSDYCFCIWDTEDRANQAMAKLIKAARANELISVETGEEPLFYVGMYQLNKLESGCTIVENKNLN